MEDINFWINLDKFTTYQITVTAIGWVFWISFYALICHSIVKDKYVEMPWLCVCVNIAWEGVWGFGFSDQIDLGYFFILNYRAWFLLDIFILWGVFKYGRKQIDIPELKKYLVPIVISACIIFAALIYTFIDSGFDYRWGSQSAYIMNLFISMFFITLFLRQWRFKHFSKVMAWFKCLGTLAYTIVYFQFDPPNSFVHLIGFVVLFLDLIFLYLLHTRQGKSWQKQQAPWEVAEAN